MGEVSCSKLFLDLCRSGRIQELFILFKKHKHALIKELGPVAVYNELLANGLHELAFSVIKRFRYYENRFKLGKSLTFRNGIVWYYCQEGAFDRALWWAHEFLKEANELDKKIFYGARAMVYYCQENYGPALESYYLSLGHPKIRGGDTSAWMHIAWIYCLMGNVPKALEIINNEKFSLDVPHYRRTFDLLKCEILLKENKISELIAYVQDFLKQEDLTDPEDFYYYLAEAHKVLGDKDKACEYYLKTTCDQNIFSLYWKNAKAYNRLYQLGYESLTIDKKIAGICHPLLTQIESESATYLVKGETISKWDGDYDSLQGVVFDFVSGRLIINDKVTLLSELQAKLCLCVYGSGCVGVSFAQLEKKLFDTIYQDEEVAEKRIANLIISLKKYNIEFHRERSVLKARLNPDFNYLIPTQGEFRGYLSVIPPKSSFNRNDLQKLLSIQRSMAGLYIQNWLKENKIAKRGHSKNAEYMRL